MWYGGFGWARKLKVIKGGRGQRNREEIAPDKTAMLRS